MQSVSRQGAAVMIITDCIIRVVCTERRGAVLPHAGQFADRRMAMAPAAANALAGGAGGARVRVACQGLTYAQVAAEVGTSKGAIAGVPARRSPVEPRAARQAPRLGARSRGAVPGSSAIRARPIGHGAAEFRRWARRTAFDTRRSPASGPAMLSPAPPPSASNRGEIHV
jgi:hypothetical protein